MVNLALDSAGASDQQTDKTEIRPREVVGPPVEVVRVQC